MSVRKVFPITHGAGTSSSEREHELILGRRQCRRAARFGALALALTLFISRIQLAIAYAAVRLQCRIYLPLTRSRTAT